MLRCIDDSYKKLLEEIIQNPPQLLVFDRCLDSNKVFLEVLRARRYIGDLEYYVIKNQIDQLHSKYFGEQIFACDKICFIDTPISDCVQRLERRGRAAELLFKEDIDSYQTFLLHFYREHLLLFEALRGEGSVLKLDTREDLDLCLERFFIFADHVQSKTN